MNSGLKICSTLLILLLCSDGAYPAASGSDDAMAVVLEVLRGDDEEMHAVAIAMVKEMPGPEVTKALAAELANLSPRSQVQLISALADRGDSAALPAIVEAVGAKDESVRIESLKALGQLGGASTVDLLARAAASARGAEQNAAQESLYRLRGADVDRTIVGSIDEAEPKTKVELIAGVGRRNIVAGFETLLQTAKDADRKVRIESLKVLKAISGPEKLAVLVDLLVNVRSSSDRTEAEKTVAAVARKIEDKNRRAEAVLAVLPSAKDVAKRISLLSVLGKIGDDSALPVLRKELSSEEAGVRVAVIRALSDWPSAEPAADLLSLARKSENPLHQVLALRGFVRLLGLDSERPAHETIAMYKEAMSLAANAVEKRRVLSGLSGAPSVDALKMAAGYLEDKELSREAEVAVVKIAGAVWEESPQESSDILKKIVAATKNDAVRKQAQDVIEKIEESQKQPEV